MRIDEELLLSHRRFERPAEGYSETLLQPTLGLGDTIAVLAEPLGEARGIGWVVCHAYGIEQIHLSRLDVIAARSLAAAGFTVLRFHGQGYGDARGAMDVVGLDSHLRESADAVRLLREQTGVEQVGAMGARFGGAVAALVAERMGLALMALWEPVVRGRDFLRDLFRSEALAEIVGGLDGGGAAPMRRLQDELAERGWVDIKGFPISREASDQIGAMDLTHDLRTFGGSALVVGLSRSGRPSSQVATISQHLAGLSVSSTLEMIQDAVAPQFGQFRWRTIEGGRSKMDTQLELNEKIAAATVEWAIRQVDPSSQPAEARR